MILYQNRHILDLNAYKFISELSIIIDNIRKSEFINSLFYSSCLLIACTT
ncbi:unnamed protein product [Moneuplotes crassus]|uniref:Uncharacterized protein n=1 Tax=Euplotes crassus TaxID=5936 RepID=A0AAD2D9P4_EUPCR|nr:unnamed protein product [Moneuplotes crassus]